MSLLAFLARADRGVVYKEVGAAAAAYLPRVEDLERLLSFLTSCPRADMSCAGYA